MLIYLFVCFSVGLVCLGALLGILHRVSDPIARGFTAFYAFLTVSLLAGLVLSFVGVPATDTTSETRAVLEYLEAMVGFYGMLFTLPYFTHRVFAAKEHWRDRLLLTVVGVAFISQHLTEYGFAGRWDTLGDLGENLLFATVIVYAFLLGVRRLGAPSVDRTLARRFLLLLGIGLPISIHDLFLMDVTGLRFYPFLCCAWCIVATCTLYRRAEAKSTQPPIPFDWELTERESEVLSLVLKGLSNKEIASQLFISDNMVKTHLRKVFDKSGHRSRVALISMLGTASVAE